MRFALTMTEVFLTLTVDLPYFFLSCKANARVKHAKTGHGRQSSILVAICVLVAICELVAICVLVVICVVWLLFVLFYVLFVCKCVLTPGDNPIAINKYIISYTWYLLFCVDD
jgi:hypothetical protein